MAIEAVQKSNGSARRANAVCDDCKHKQPVVCDYHRRRGGAAWDPDEGQVHRKLESSGWTYIKKKLRCPDCEGKRKEKAMKTTQAKAETPAARQPSRRERIEIITMLAEVYDIDAGRYRNNDNDDSVADVLGVLPGWVAEIREAEFGPDGSSEDIEELTQKIDAFERDASAIVSAATDLGENARKKLAEVAVMKVELDRIKKALSPRLVKATGVK